MTENYPRQGEIYLVKALHSIEDTKKRPAVVVSSDIRNEFSHTVLIIPFTKDLSGGENSNRILIPKGEGGLEEASLAICDNVLAVRKLYLERGPYSQISPEFLESIQKGIQVVIGVF